MELPAVAPLDADAMGAADARQGRLTKPPGSMGHLEALGTQLAGIAGARPPPPVPEPVAVAVFAGDHGGHAQGVTPWPQEVTVQMVANVCAGGAVVNALARQMRADVVVVDVGVAGDAPPHPCLTTARIARGTADLLTGPAMSLAQARQGVETGVAHAYRLVDAGYRLLVTGDLGLANTTPAAALVAALTRTDAPEVTGRGAGSDDAMLAHKVDVVCRAVARIDHDADPLVVLAEVGGFEHAALAGFLLGRPPGGYRLCSTASSPAPPRSWRPRSNRVVSHTSSPATVLPNPAPPSPCAPWVSTHSSTWSSVSARARAPCWRYRWSRRRPGRCPRWRPSSRLRSPSAETPTRPATRWAAGRIECS